jgi:hypothetical protein
MRKVYISAGKPEGEILLGRHGRSWKYNIYTDFK